jgi:hypothetical protein
MRRLTILALVSLALAGCSSNSGQNSSAPTPIVINCDTASQEDWVKYCASPAPESSSPMDSDTGTEERGDEDFKPLPFDGGVFTWSNRIQVTTKVEKVEKWGEHSDFCDGCLALEPDDYRFALRFTVHVPKSYGKLLDVTSCSGTLSVDDGNDDDAFTEVAGDYNKGLDGKMRPGATKYGVNEYGIKKKYVERGITFTYTNSCGDPDYETGEVGIWNGKIPVSKR